MAGDDDNRLISLLSAVENRCSTPHAGYGFLAAIRCPAAPRLAYLAVFNHPDAMAFILPNETWDDLRVRKTWNQDADDLRRLATATGRWPTFVDPSGRFFPKIRVPPAGVPLWSGWSIQCVQLRTFQAEIEKLASCGGGAA